MLWILDSDVTKEGVQGCQSDIASGDRVVTFLFQGIEESDDVFGLEVAQVERRNGPAAMGRHEGQGITVAVDGVRTQAPQTGEVVAEKRAQSTAQCISSWSRHRTPPLAVA